MIRQIVRSCNECFWFKPEASYPLMGNVPPYRVNMALKPFIDTGVDYAGPFSNTLTWSENAKGLYMFIRLFGYQDLTFRSCIRFIN